MSIDNRVNGTGLFEIMEDGGDEGLEVVVGGKGVNTSSDDDGIMCRV